MSNAQNDPAVLGPVERPVRPGAEARRLAKAIDPLRRKEAPDHLTVGCAARMIEGQSVEIERLRARLDDALFVLGMVDKNNRIDAGENGKAWNGRFVAEEARRVLDDAARAAGA